MIPIDDDQKLRFQIRLSIIQQEHRDLDAAIHAIRSTSHVDPMLIQRLKKKKLQLRDEIAKLEQYLLPDIIA